MQLFILSLGRSFWVSYCLILGFIFWGFYAHMVASVFISHLREKTVSVCAPEMCRFLSAVVAPVKIVGCQGWNSLTKISCQVKMSERIRYLFISSCHSQGMESECLFPAVAVSPSGVCGSSASAWAWAIKEVYLKLQGKTKVEAGASCLGRWLCGSSLYLSVKSWIFANLLSSSNNNPRKPFLRGAPINHMLVMQKFSHQVRCKV